MRYITERELRDQFASGVPDRYDVPSGCMLTPAARQYLRIFMTKQMLTE